LFLSGSAGVLPSRAGKPYIYTVMTGRVPKRKLYRTALTTSLILVLALAFTPHVLLGRAIPFHVFFTGLFYLSSFLVFIWVVNIFLLLLFSGKDQNGSRNRYIISYLASLFFLFMAAWLTQPPIPYASRASAHFYAIFALGVILNTIVVIIQDLVIMRENKAMIELENAELRVKNVQAAHEQLKQQLHPHFLFNSLSTLKSLIRKNSALAEEYLLKLSALLRASLLSGTLSTELLSAELARCRDYLDMQQIRFGEALTYKIVVPEAVMNTTSIPVFALLSLVENAIKHNTLTIEAPLSISIHYSNDRIIVINNKQHRLPAEVSTGLGLENLRERYKLLGGEDVQVSDLAGSFEVSIKLFAHEDHHNRG
jgi:two-component system LytT family sensor kinase